MSHAEISLTLYYTRTNTDENFKTVPDLTDKDFSKFILNGDILSAFNHEFSTDKRYGTVSNMKYNEEGFELTFDMSIKEDTLTIKVSDGIRDIVEQILDTLVVHMEDDGLYDRINSAYTLKYAKDIYGDSFDTSAFDDMSEEDLTLIQIGSIDFKKTFLMVFAVFYFYF
jgi:hypothetical protein